MKRWLSFTILRHPTARIVTFFVRSDLAGNTALCHDDNAHSRPHTVYVLANAHALLLHHPHAPSPRSAPLPREHVFDHLPPERVFTTHLRRAHPQPSPAGACSHPSSAAHPSSYDEWGRAHAIIRKHVNYLLIVQLYAVSVDVEKKKKETYDDCRFKRVNNKSASTWTCRVQVLNRNVSRRTMPTCENVLVQISSRIPSPLTSSSVTALQRINALTIRHVAKLANTGTKPNVPSWCERKPSIVDCQAGK